jgi:PAS domain S-box-containing protein
MTESSFRRLLLRFALVPVVGLSLLLAVLGFKIHQISLSRVQGSEATATLLQSDRLLQSMIDEETGIRGYLATRDPVFLQPYRDASARFGSELSTLSALASRSSSLSRKVESIVSSFHDFDAINQALLKTDLPNDAVQSLLKDQKRAMDTLRVELEDLAAEENEARSANRQTINTLFSTLPVFGIGGGALIAFIVIWHGTFLFRQLSQAFRKQLDESMMQRDSLHTTLHSIGDAVIVCDSSSNITLLNPTAEEVTGWTKAQAIGQPLDAVFHIINEETRQLVESPVAKVTRLGAVVDLANHTLLIRKDGVEIPIDDSGAPIWDASRALAGVILVFRSVAERRQAENALRLSEERLKLATEVAEIGIFVWDPAQDRASWENERMYQIFGRTREDGPLTSAEFLREVIIHPDYQEAFRESMEISLQNGDGFHFEGTIRVPNNTERCIEINGRLQSQADGSGTHILGAIRDITHITKSKQALKENAKRLGELAAIVESSDDVILSKDLNGVITSWNAAATRLFGYSAEEMIGASILKLIPEHLHSDETIILESIRAGRRIEHFETVRLTKSGELLDVSLTISPLKDEQGQVIGASKILRDISGRKRVEQSLLQAEKIAATGRMAATIAHEINNPLESVTNLLYLLRPMITDPDGMSYLSSAEIELGRVSHIAKQTLGYYREHAAASRASMTEIVLHAITIYGPRCTAASIEIRTELDSSRRILMRRGEMMQVISNLVMNSIYAMPAGGVLSISVEDVMDSRDGILLTVQDDGVGIAPDALPRVFEAFFTTRATVGTGIGLFVTKEFVEGHGGQIEIQSRNDREHHGTIVRVFLPIDTSYDVSGN